VKTDQGLLLHDPPAGYWLTILVVRIGFGKLGNIGSAPLLEFLLDERAERKDIEVRVVSSGAKMGVEQASDVAQKLSEFKPDLAVVTSPNAALPGPTKLREILIGNRIPTIVISDSPAKKAVQDIEKAGAGYLIVEADSMIGARREFLDPSEMALFNADLFKVLTVTGVFNVLWQEIDKVVQSIQKGAAPALPRIVINKEKAIESSGLNNPYARTKAMAAHEIARRVADLTVEGCFVVKEWEHYTQLVAAAHEMIREAARLADEAREIDKAQDMILRTPHNNEGALLQKRKLLEKPSKVDSTPH
jgi:methylenetetrahydromethanopterin dehydrogenase